MFRMLPRFLKAVNYEAVIDNKMTDKKNNAKRRPLKSVR